MQGGYIIYYRHTELFVTLREMWTYEDYGKPFCRVESKTNLETFSIG